jgi:predicted nucleic acid-binding protein
VFNEARRGDLFLIAPDVLFSEFGHGLRKYSLGGRLAPKHALLIWQRLIASSIPETVPARYLGEEALALKHQASFYDALYIALAKREDVKVLTADNGMANAFAPLERTVRLADLAGS